jgi:cardiolipin synthase (CMP-forming)
MNKASLPTTLTILRIAMGPALAALILLAASVLYSDRLLAGWIYALTLILFALSAATDWLDGALARRWNVVTPLGAALDHTADKVLIVSVLLALAFAALPLELTAAALIIVARDVAMSGLREAASAQGKTLPVSALGKWKAAAEMAGVGAFLAYQATALLFAQDAAISGLFWAARILIWTAAALALISGANYVAALTRKI